MPRYRAQDIILTVGTAIAHITQGTLDRSVALVETTGGGDTGRNREPGYKDFTLSGTSRFNGDQLQEGDEVTASMAIEPPSGGTVSIFTGTGIVNQFQVGGSHEDAVDVTFQVTRSKD
jgi:hypothetical protein